MREKNRAEIIQDAINLLDDELILETDKIREKSVNTTSERSSIIKTRKSWRRFTALAASVAVFLIAGFVWNEVIVPNQADEGIAEECAEQEISSNSNSGHDSVAIEDCEELDELNETPDVDGVAKTESMMQQKSEDQIHLPNQELESVAAVESLVGVVIPAMEVELGRSDDGVEADMMAFFIYDGRCYVQSEYYKNGLALVGDYVGTAVGLIDEWTKEDGYVDYAGSIAGKFYEVKGYDPSFMLCMKYENGAVETFINNNGITLGKGSDLVEDRLHLKDNFEKVTFKTQKEWNESLQDENNHVLPEKYDELMESFLESFSSENFVHIKDTPLDVDGAGRYHENMDKYHIIFYTKDGLRFDFVLYEDGYVSFHGFYSVCVPIDSELYEELIKVLEEEL